MIPASERTSRNQRWISDMSCDGDPCRIAAVLKLGSPRAYRSFSRCNTSHAPWPCRPHSRGHTPDPPARPGGNSYTPPFMTFCMPTPAIHSSSSSLPRSPYSRLLLSFLFVRFRYPRGGKKTRPAGSSLIGEILHFYCCWLRPFFSTFYFFYFLVLEHLPAGVPSGFHPLVLECC